MRIHKMTLDSFYLYLVIGDLHQLAKRFGFSEDELRERAVSERWDERVEAYEERMESLSRDEQVLGCHQLWLAMVVLLTSGSIAPGILMGCVPLGTHLLVQVQGKPKSMAR